MAQSQNHYQFIVDNPGIRLDKFIGDNCPEVSRTQAQRLIIDGHVIVNGRQEKTSYKLETGECIVVKIPPPLPSSLLPEPIPIRILYEDNDLLVVDKPAGLAVHPAPGHPDHTLVNAVLSHLSSLPDIQTTVRPGIVHRLDKDTSGVMLVAKNAAALANLSDQFKSRSVKKVYLTLIRGHLRPERGIIEAPIGRDSSNRKKMSVTGENRGRRARTNYQVIKYLDKYTLLEITLETGRTHQIRVHLSAIGYPVVGDETYGVKSAGLNRQFLHAHRLGFHLPSSGEYVEFESPLPADLEKVLSELS